MLLWRLIKHISCHYPPLEEKRKVFFYFPGSGLFLASRFPFLAVEYLPFENKKSNWQAFISYGLIMAKVDLDNGKVTRALHYLYMLYEAKRFYFRNFLMIKRDELGT